MPDIKENYNDGSYLSKNLNWHQEDSPYKSNMVSRMINKHEFDFNSCADVGCGAGLVTKILADKYKKTNFIGYDLSDDASKFWSKFKANNLIFKKADLLTESNTFDLVVGLQCIYYNTDLKFVIKEVKRVLKKNGKFIFSFFSKDHGYMNYIDVVNKKKNIILKMKDLLN